MRVFLIPLLWLTTAIAAVDRWVLRRRDLAGDEGYPDGFSSVSRTHW
jgi:hypothetical protein